MPTGRYDDFKNLQKGKMEVQGGLSYCNMGVVDISELNNRGEGTTTSFSLATFRANNPAWGPAEPRPRIAYPYSSSIELFKLADVVAKHSVKEGGESSQNRTLRDAMYEYVMLIDSAKHLFCIHSRSNPDTFYERIVLKIPRKLTEMRNVPHPQVIIITENADNSSRIFAALWRERNKMEINRNACSIRNLDKALPSENTKRDRSDKIVIGSVTNMKSFCDDYTRDSNAESFVSSVKFIILHGAEKIHSNSDFRTSIGYFSQKFGYSWTRFIFMYNFAEAQKPLLKTVQSCRSLFKEGMFIEVEKPKVRDLFQRVEFKLIVPSTEIADRQAAICAQRTGTEFPIEKHVRIKVIAGALFQKRKECMSLIRRLREERERMNSRQKNKRRERILVVTKNHRHARMVMLMLCPEKHSNSDNFEFNINLMVEYDSVEVVEKRNFEFRHGTLDVLVIDWRSIQSVIRGTVDSVIMYDRPHPYHFQTIMETEMENLTSRNCVKLKLFIFVDQTEDLILIPQYQKFVQKYRKPVPQWFPSLLEKSITDMLRRKAERALDQDEDTLINTPSSNATLQ